jgi:hypothetical protein
MKFLCVPCDSPMKLQTVEPPQHGSLSVVYSCPECGYEMAMLTNPFETQLVQSLGVRIGPAMGGGSTASAGARSPVPDARLPDGGATERGATASSGRCPFPAMVPATEGALDGAGPSAEPASGPVSSGGQARHVPSEAAVPVRWTRGAEARLANIPAFVRPMARTGIEQYARETGALEVDEQILDAAREFFGM